MEKGWDLEGVCWYFFFVVSQARIEFGWSAEEKAHVITLVLGSDGTGRLPSIKNLCPNSERKLNFH